MPAFYCGSGLSTKFGNPKIASLAGLAVATSGPPRQPAAQSLLGLPHTAPIPAVAQD